MAGHELRGVRDAEANRGERVEINGASVVNLTATTGVLVRQMMLDGQKTGRG